MDINELSTDELKVIVAEREAAERKKDIPQPLKTPNYGRILASAVRHIKYVGSKDFCEDNDETHYIYEDVIESIYGTEIWDWINSH